MSVTPDTAAPTGRNKPAQGKERSDAALGHASQNPSSPQGAKELPHGWKHVRLGDIAQTTSGGTPRRDKPQYYGGTIPWVKSGELGDRVVYETSETLSDEGLTSSNAKVFPKGTLCIALYGATVGKLGILGVDAATNQAVCAIFPPEGLDTRYLYRFFEGKRRELIEQGKGGAQSNISQGIIRDTMFPLPPLPEQRRIVAEIEKQFTRLEAGVAALRRVQANLKRYRAAVLKAACEGRLVPTEAALQSGSGVPPLGSGKKRQDAASTFETGETLLARILTERRQNWQGRGKYKEPAAPKTADLPALPGGWTWANGEQLVSWSSGEGLTQKDIQEGQYPVYGGNGVTGYHNAFVAEIPTLVIGRVGALCGNVYLTDGAAWITDNAIYAIQTPSCVAMRFIRLAFTRAELNKRATGSGQPFVNQRMLNETVIPLPPLAEQTRIVAEVERRLSVVEELESVVTANLQRATRLRQSILQRAFCGKLLSNDCHADKTNP
jgi:type I restriction enzyme S subunit